MNANSRSTRGLTITVALVGGFLIGALVAAWALYAVLPPSTLVSNVSPAFLLSSKDIKKDGNPLQYREVYAAQIARRYTDRLGLGQNPAKALDDAQNALGVATGDVTPAQAAEIMRTAWSVGQAENTSEVAKSGNIQDADGGWVTQAEVNSLDALATQLEQTATVKGETDANNLFNAARSRLQMIGLLLTLLLAGIVFLLLYFASQYDNEGLVESVRNTLLRQGGFASGMRQAVQNVASNIRNRTNPNMRVQPNVPPYVPQYAQQNVPPTPPSVNVVVNQPPPSYAPPPYQAQSMPVQPLVVDVDPMQAGYLSQDPTSQMQMEPMGAEEFLTSFDPTMYQHGDDSYEEVFNINAPSGEFLGECGAGIASRLDLSVPSKVCALGVWGFDKTDPNFKSVTKVLMTPNAYNDPIIRKQLEKMGDHVLAQNGTFEIHTATLRIEVTVSNLNVNPAGFFNGVTLSYQVYRKN